jgi:hypothetical protein
MTTPRYTMKVSGDFNVKIDNEEMRMFIMPTDRHAWYYPQGSKFRFKLKPGEYTEIFTVVFKDGNTSFIPKKYLKMEEYDN